MVDNYWRGQNAGEMWLFHWDVVCDWGAISTSDAIHPPIYTSYIPISLSQKKTNISKISTKLWPVGAAIEGCFLIKVDI